jgi:glycerol-3-phosphate dehydrogenase
MPTPETERYDLIVVGGGINGAATARDAQMRGLRVLLLEKEDISHAASAWNSRMIHGGIKYLETYEVGLVRESLREREWLLRAAPHLVKPLPFLMPFLKGNRRPPWLLRLGMVGYDVLSLDKSLPRHRILDRDGVLRIAPSLVEEEVQGGALFHDAQAEFAERLGVETVLSAAEHGAVVRTHTRATRLRMLGGRVVGVEYLDTITGRSGTAHADVVINATGAWVDDLLAGLPDHDRPLVGGTKGTHLVVDTFPGAPSEALYYEARSDGRPVLVIPWLGRYLIGSTDVRVSGDLDQTRADRSEIEYILSETNTLMPDARLTAADVRFIYTGVRPLPYQPDDDVAKITRHHVVHDHAPKVQGLLSLVGGKLTTFRALGEDAVDAAMRKLGRRAKCTTRSHSLPGAMTPDFSGYAATFGAGPGAGYDPDLVARLVRIYGVRARGILEIAQREQAMKRVLDGSHSVLAAEVVHAVRHEFARTLDDVLMRRTMIGLEPGVDLALVEDVARVLADEERWDRTRTQEEIDRYLTVAAAHRPASTLMTGARPESSELVA